MSTQRRLKDIDSAERSFRIKALVWSMSAGVLTGVAGWLLIGPIALLIGFPLGWGVAYVLTATLVHHSGRAAQVLYNPSGSSTPFKREYSQPQALVMQGKYREAAEAFEAACREFADDPTPYLHLARLLRDHLNEYETAARWLREARKHATLTSGQELLIVQELAALYVMKLDAPRRAIPELALLKQRFPGTAVGDAAARELEELREMLAIEQDGGPSVTQQFRARHPPRPAESER